MELKLNIYYDDNAKRLRAEVDKILSKFGGISDKDKDDFYSLANEIFARALKRYDDSQPFDAFLYSCLSNGIKTEMTRRNRQKRKADRMAVSIDTPVGDDGDYTIKDVIADSFNMETAVFGEENADTVKIAKYLDRLSKRQRRVAALLAASYKAGEIMDMLNITKKEYADAINGMRSYENISVLF